MAALPPLPACFRFARALLFAAIALMAAAAAAEERTETGFGEELVFKADEITFNTKTKEAAAIGDVEVTNGGYRLTADAVTYNENTGIVHAIGHLKITDPNGDALYLDEAMLDNQLREGFIINLRFVFAEGARLAARDGERKEGNKSTLNYAVFTPCEACADNPDKTPSWQIKAVRVTHDQNKRRIYYKDVTLELFGVPIAYLPWFSHPDPTVRHASGFLIPEVKLKREFGLMLEIPYYISLSPSADVTVTPIITSKEGLVLAVEHRRNLGFGAFTIAGSITRPDAIDFNGVKVGGKDLRGHFFAEGDFRITPEIDTFVQFRFVSDDTYLRRYDFGNYDTLESQLRTQGIFGRSYFSVQSLWFQGLRVEDVQGLTGFALPMVNADVITRPGWGGSTFRLHFNALALHRTDGMDTTRLSFSGGWQLPHTTRWGAKLLLALNIRGDIYNIRDAANPDTPVWAGVNGTESRLLPELTASFSYPLVRTGRNVQQVIEPVVEFIAAPKGGNPPGLSNEDSRTFELNDLNILSPDRMPGYDLWEGGSRFNYGVRYMVVAPNVQFEGFVGLSQRFSPIGADPEDPLLPAGAGLSDNLSDVVTRVNLTVRNAVQITQRMRLDPDGFTVRRNEIDATVFIGDGEIGIGYFKTSRMEQVIGLEDHEEIRLFTAFNVSTTWRVFGDITRNLTAVGDTISQGAGIVYSDDCVELTFSWRKSFTRDRDVVPGSSVYLKLRLKGFG
jgi:LPS-assembly protein